MVDPKQLTDLQTVTDAHYTAAKAKLAEITRQEANIRAQLESLVQRRNEEARRDRPAGEAALQSGADVRWHRWIDQRRATLNQELAALRAKRAGLKATLQKAFGRNEAVRQMRLRAAAELAQSAKNRVY